MKNIFTLLIIGIFVWFLPIETLSKTKKELKNAEKITRYEKAKEVLKNMTFGVEPDYLKTRGGFLDLYQDQKSFMGFEDEKLVLQGYFYGVRGIFEVSNYIYSEDNKGNVIVTFDFSGRINYGKIKINMKSGDNYVEISQSINSSNRIFTGNILPSEDIDYTYIVTTI